MLLIHALRQKALLLPMTSQRSQLFLPLRMMFCGGEFNKPKKYARRQRTQPPAEDSIAMERQINDELAATASIPGTRFNALAIEEEESQEPVSENVSMNAQQATEITQLPPVTIPMLPVQVILNGQTHNFDESPSQTKKSDSGN